MLLRDNGLKIAHILKLIRMWSLGANTDIMRALAVNETWSTKCDQQISQAISDLVGTDLNEIQQAICYIKMKDGGLGLGSTTRRHEAAWIGACMGGRDEQLAWTARVTEHRRIGNRMT